MKYTKLAILLSATAAILTGCGDSADSGPKLWPVLLILLSLALLALAGLRTYSIIQYNRRRAKSSRRRRPRSLDPMTIGMFALAALLLLGSLLGSCNGNDIPDSTVDSTPPTETGNNTPVSLFIPKAADDAYPNNWGIRWEIIENGKIVHNYNRQEPITLGNPEDYFALPGVATFRGNNYRDNAAYGTATVKDKTLSMAWTVGSTKLPGGIWEGSGWTGQPLIVKWDDATKAIMNLYADKKTKAGLVEVIYATLDGHIYFLDL